MQSGNQPIAIAIILQALVFGALHWQGGGSMVFLITALGGLVFAVLDMFDGYTIWSGFVLHVSLNATWSIFVVSGNATSGLAGIVLRLASAVIALLLLGFFCRRHKVHAMTTRAV